MGTLNPFRFFVNDNLEKKKKTLKFSLILMKDSILTGSFNS